MQAAIDATCDCNTEEGEEEAAAANGEEQAGPGKCISQITKLRKTLRNLSFFGLTDTSTADIKAMIKENKKACVQAKSQ